MSFFSRIFGTSSSRRGDSSNRAEVKPGIEVTLPKRTPVDMIKGVREIGTCGPGVTCMAQPLIIAPTQMRDLISNVPQFKSNSVLNAVFPGGLTLDLPQPALSLAVALLAHRKPDRVGILHWRVGRHLFLRVEALEALFLAGIEDFSYPNVVRVLAGMGWKSIDIEFSTNPCDPFNDTLPRQLVERTAHIPVLSMDGLTDRGNELSAAGRGEEALACFDQATERNPGNGNAWACKAATLFELKRFEEALESANFATIVHPGLGAAWYNKGSALGVFSRYSDALACFEEAHRLGVKEAAGAISICRKVLR